MRTKQRRLSDIYEFPAQKTPQQILLSAQSIFTNTYPEKEFRPVKETFSYVIDLFNGKVKGYRQCNTIYHDINHTTSAFLVLMQLIDGYNLTSSLGFNCSDARIGLIAALLHDTGFIQTEDDTRGTGAKYTLVHIDRSLNFAKKYLKEKNYSPEEISAVGNIIRCTGLYPEISTIKFGSEAEKLLGYMLGTADLLGQMSDPVYLEKLLFLYREFKEGNVLGYENELDLLRKTIDFYQYVQNLFNTTFCGVYKYVEKYFKKRLNIEGNLYIESIDNQVNYLKRMIEELKENYRTGLRRKVLTYS